MMNVKSEIQYILVTRTLEDVAQAGFLTVEELNTAKRLATSYGYARGMTAGRRIAPWAGLPRVRWPVSLPTRASAVPV